MRSMTQNSNTYYKFLQILIQVLIVMSFFFKIFNYHEGNQIIPISGFEALIKNSYFIVGNIFIWFMLLGSIYHLFVQLFVMISKKVNPKLETSLVIILNLQLFFGLFVVTFLGRYLEMLGIFVVGLIILGAVIKYKYKT
jgi:hypothetical protein